MLSKEALVTVIKKERKLLKVREYKLNAWMNIYILKMRFFFFPLVFLGLRAETNKWHHL